jgi:hypothetical protein
MVANSKYESAEGSTEVYSVLTMVCVNPRCEKYAGTDLNNPLKVAAIIRKRVN